MSDKILCPSTMCVDFLNLREEITTLEKAGADILHNDIMDGCFVPNMTLGLNDLRAIRKCTDKMLDVHLMIENALNKVDWFIDAGADLVYVHPEGERYTVKTLLHIRDRGCKTGIAINPDTAVACVEDMLSLCDYVLVMTVSPGFAGQKYVEFCTNKVKQLASLKERYGFKIVIDGACSPQRIAQLSAIGADGFVLGTSALFGKGRPYADIMSELRKL